MSKEFTVTFPDSLVVSRKLVRALMPKIVKMITEDARQRAPRRRGLLREKIEGRVEQSGDLGVVAAKAPHSHLVHEGTKGHPIVVKNARALPIPAGGHVVFRGSAYHPGTRAQPFLRDALEGNVDAVAGMLRNAGENALAEAIGK